MFFDFGPIITVEPVLDEVLQITEPDSRRGFTLNEASRMAGVAKSAPYRHFPDRDSLLAEIAVLGNRTMKAELRAASLRGKTERQRLLNVLLDYIAFANRHPAYFAVMFQSGIDKNPYPKVRKAAKRVFAVAADLAARIESAPNLGARRE